MLNSQDIRRFQERLKAERDTIESRIATNKRGIQETVRDESGVGDFEDEASLITEREAEIDENDRDRKELAQVKRALERIEHGTCGLSEVSGKPIPIERLEAVPYAQPSSMSARRKLSSLSAPGSPGARADLRRTMEGRPLARSRSGGAASSTSSRRSTTKPGASYSAAPCRTSGKSGRPESLLRRRAPLAGYRRNDAG